MILFRVRAPRLLPEHPDCSRISYRTLWLTVQQARPTQKVVLDKRLQGVLCVAAADLDVEEGVEVRDDDVLVLHLAAHVLDGVDGGLVVGRGPAAVREVLHPRVAHLKQPVEHQPGQLHGVELWGAHTTSLVNRVDSLKLVDTLKLYRQMGGMVQLSTLQMLARDAEGNTKKHKKHKRNTRETHEKHTRNTRETQERHKRHTRETHVCLWSEHKTEDEDTEWSPIQTQTSPSSAQPTYQ